MAEPQMRANETKAINSRTTQYKPQTKPMESGKSFNDAFLTSFRSELLSNDEERRRSARNEFRQMDGNDARNLLKAVGDSGTPDDAKAFAVLFDDPTIIYDIIAYNGKGPKGLCPKCMAYTGAKLAASDKIGEDERVDPLNLVREILSHLPTEDATKIKEYLEQRASQNGTLNNILSSQTLSAIINLNQNTAQESVPQPIPTLPSENQKPDRQADVQPPTLQLSEQKPGETVLHDENLQISIRVGLGIPLDITIPNNVPDRTQTAGSHDNITGTGHRVAAIETMFKAQSGFAVEDPNYMREIGQAECGVNAYSGSITADQAYSDSNTKNIKEESTDLCFARFTEKPTGKNSDENSKPPGSPKKGGSTSKNQDNKRTTAKKFRKFSNAVLPQSKRTVFNSLITKNNRHYIGLHAGVAHMQESRKTISRGNELIEHLISKISSHRSSTTNRTMVASKEAEGVSSDVLEKEVTLSTVKKQVRKRKRTEKPGKAVKPTKIFKNKVKEKKHRMDKHKPARETKHKIKNRSQTMRAEAKKSHHGASTSKPKLTTAESKKKFNFEQKYQTKRKMIKKENKEPAGKKHKRIMELLENRTEQHKKKARSGNWRFGHDHHRPRK